MRHPSDGTLRRLVDEPAGVADADRAHVLGCPDCLGLLAEIQLDAERSARALGVGSDASAASADVDRGWQRLSRSVARPAPERPTVRRRSSWATVLRSPVAAAVGVAVLLGGAGAAAAADWLPIFRAEQVAPVEVTRADAVQLPDLSAYGTVRAVQEPDLRSVPDARAAQQASGLEVPTVAELPRGVAGDPVYQVGDRTSLEFTFSAEKAARAAAEQGEEAPAPPAGLDGSRFRLTAGPGVAAVWSSEQGLPALAVARAVAPAVDSSGVPFDTVRDYLLSLPGIPDDLAAQLAAFPATGTLPLPVPAEHVSSSETDLDGTPVTVLTSDDHSMSAAVWVEDGVVTAVGGSLSTDEVLEVARGLE
jgi:hypothetical protein